MWAVGPDYSFQPTLLLLTEYCLTRLLKFSVSFLSLPYFTTTSVRNTAYDIRQGSPPSLDWKLALIRAMDGVAVERTKRASGPDHWPRLFIHTIILLYYLPTLPAQPRKMESAREKHQPIHPFPLIKLNHKSHTYSIPPPTCYRTMTHSRAFAFTSMFELHSSKLAVSLPTLLPPPMLASTLEAQKSTICCVPEHLPRLSPVSSTN
jgi:hypothetical protein